MGCGMEPWRDIARYERNERVEVKSNIQVHASDAEIEANGYEDTAEFDQDSEQDNYDQEYSDQATSEHEEDSEESESESNDSLRHTAVSTKRNDHGMDAIANETQSPSQ